MASITSILTKALAEATGKVVNPIKTRLSNLAHNQTKLARLEEELSYPIAHRDKVLHDV